MTRCQSEYLGTSRWIPASNLPFQRSAALGGPFFVSTFRISGFSALEACSLPPPRAITMHRGFSSSAVCRSIASVSLYDGMASLIGRIVYQWHGADFTVRWIGYFVLNTDERPVLLLQRVSIMRPLSSSMGRVRKLKRRLFGVSKRTQHNFVSHHQPSKKPCKCKAFFAFTRSLIEPRNHSNSLPFQQHRNAKQTDQGNNAMVNSKQDRHLWNLKDKSNWHCINR